MTALFFLLILACPLIMMFMMRGHGHGGHGDGDGGDTAHAGHEPATDSLDDLKRRRSALDDEIASRENR